MRARDGFELVLLAALWGGSFLFMRVAAPEFGPIALMALRVAIGAAFLIGVLALTGRLGILRAMSGAIALVGMANSAIPFVLLAYATLTLTAGIAAILNATAPLWAALVAFVWLGVRLSGWTALGLALGFTGVGVLVGEQALAQPGGAGIAVLAALVATLLYGIAANYTKQRLAGADPMLLATGSQLASTVVLTPFALASWPSVPASPAAWMSVIVMGVASTGIAYILYFRLIANLGPTKAIAVTFLIPLFGVAWGALFLGEPVSGQMLFGAAIVLVGTAISTGVLRLPRRMRLP